MRLADGLRLLRVWDTLRVPSRAMNISHLKSCHDSSLHPSSPFPSFQARQIDQAVKFMVKSSNGKAAMPGRRTVRSACRIGEDARRVACIGGGRVRARRVLAVGRAVGWLALAGLLGFIGESQGDFRYPDFANVCDPTLPCSPDFQGTLSCCLPFETDEDSRLHVLSGAHFQTCAQANSPTGEMEGLKGRNSVFSQDRAEDPQISVTQITEVDYEAAPRKSVTYNWTRSEPPLAALDRAIACGGLLVGGRNSPSHYAQVAD